MLSKYRCETGWFLKVGFLSLCITFICFSLLKAQTQERPNILFAISDDQSFPHASAYGTNWVQTPAFDRVADQGILFTRAYVPNPKCAPSRSIILTGRNSWQLEEAANHWPRFPEKFKVYTEVLSEEGYLVGSTGKGWAPGIAQTADGSPRHLAGTPYNEITTKPPTSAINSRDYAANFEAFLESRESEDQPFSFWYGGHEPHRRYVYSSGVQIGGKEITEIDEIPSFWPDSDSIRVDILDYAMEIEYFDEHLGRMLEHLEEIGELDNTIVIVTSDNGMPFPRIKGQLYEQSAHLPLAIMWPNGLESPGRVVDDFVSFADFAPTFIELVGLEWEDTGMHPTVGKSLTDILFSDREGQVNEERDHVILGKERHDVGRPYDWGYPVRGIVKGDFLYLRNFEEDRWPVGNPETGYLNTDGSPTKSFILDHRTTAGMYHYWQWNFGKRPFEELYNISQDPNCLHNLADDPAYSDQKNHLAEDLYRKLKEQNDPRVMGRGYVFEAFPYMDRGTQNFYQRFMNGEEMNTGWVNDSDFETEPLPEQSQ
ncbi:MAG: sulfatase-like hydrolase/transferase [Bacteroidetes bacterium]|jgi:arylsulfatase A-like enzyme|nr:sulfatase-like hydrolase/transferase [Bacteroidota bacterium]